VPRIRNSFVLVCALAALLMAAPALAAQSPVITDCNAHGQLTHHYTADQLRTALNTMPPTVKEYTNCYDVINSALLAQIGGGGGGGSAGKSSGGSFLPVWLIVVLGVLIVGGGAYALMAFRRQGPGPGGAEPAPAAGTPDAPPPGGSGDEPSGGDLSGHAGLGPTGRTNK
jgi:hypothetical protein